MTSAEATSGAGQQQPSRLKERAHQFAEGFTQAAAAGGLSLEARPSDDGGEGVVITLEGDDARFFVGRHGAQILDALGYLTSLVVNGRGSGGNRLRILFDAEEYRARREATLRQLALDLAAEVRETGQEAVLDPLSPMERRIIHNAAKEIPGIRTYSEGEEPDRYIIISPDTND